VREFENLEMSLMILMNSIFQSRRWNDSETPGQKKSRFKAGYII